LNASNQLDKGREKMSASYTEKDLASQYINLFDALANVPTQDREGKLIVANPGL